MIWYTLSYPRKRNALNLLKISGITAQNLVARATGHPGFVHTWFKNNGSHPRTVILPYDSQGKQQTIYLNSGTWLIFVMQPSFLQGWNWTFKYNSDKRGVKLNLQMTCCVHFCATDYPWQRKVLFCIEGELCASTSSQRSVLWDPQHLFLQSNECETKIKSKL